MEAAGDHEQIREALSIIGQYLSDTVPPLMVSEALATLLTKPAQLMASEIVRWTATQVQEKGKTSAVDSLARALSRLNYLGQLRLVQTEALTPYLESVMQLLLQRCPPKHRARLMECFSRIGMPKTSTTATAGFKYQQGESHKTESGSQTSIVHERDKPQDQAHSQPIPAAAQANDELSSFQKNLKCLGIKPDSDQIFHELSRSLPGWMISTTGTTTAESRNPAVEAIFQAIRLAGSRWDAGKKFQELIQAAIDQFNTGSLTRAAILFEIAVSISSYPRLNSGVVTQARQSMHESLDLARLRDYAKERKQHSLLQKILNFFHEFTVDNLLNNLQKETRRDRRRTLLVLLESQGDAARKAVLQRLKDELESTDITTGWYFARNLICLLTDIPRSCEDSLKEEIDLVSPLVMLSAPVPLIKEAIRFLGKVRCDRSEELLIAAADKLESEIFKCYSMEKDPDQRLSLLDRTIFTLAHLGTPKGNARVLKHALSRYDELGDTVARLSYLSGQNLSEDRESIATLVQFIKSKMPRRLLGVTIQKNEDLLLLAVKALSSTPDVVVRLTLDVVAEQFSETKLGQAAADALKMFKAADRQGDGCEHILTGDIDLFGLPDVLQQMAQSRATGILTLKDTTGNRVGEFSLVTGRMRNCAAGRLEGIEAAFQLLQKPTAGAFAFQGQRYSATRSQPEEPKLQDIASIISEGIRRHDELQRMRAIVPDFAQLKPKEGHSAPNGEGEDLGLVNQIWPIIEAGASPEECEAAASVDSWRIRSLLARWIEAGILTVEISPSQNPARAGY